MTPQRAVTKTVQGAVDVHQHLWPPAFVDALRSRRTGPRLVGWTLHLPGEPPYDVCAGDHDLVGRARRERGDADLVLVSLSSPLGLEDLAPDQSGPLLDIWHESAAELPEPFGAWASVSRVEPDAAELDRLLDKGFRGFQVPATWLSSPQALESVAPLLAVAEAHDRPVLVHPGPADSTAAQALPGWWPALVPYVAQLHAAWWTWHVAGRSLLPNLRICFAAGAGLAPIQHERLAARGGRLTGPGQGLDRGVFVDTSSYGPQAVDALVRVLGIDAIVLGSDRPYADPAALGLGAAADRAITHTNPIRLLDGGTA
jgi:predicted TIM-barrel fold metal-dependent hydrolase